MIDNGWIKPFPFADLPCFTALCKFTKRASGAFCPAVHLPRSIRQPLTAHRVVWRRVCFFAQKIVLIDIHGRLTHPDRRFQNGAGACGKCRRCELNSLDYPVSNPTMSDPWDESRLVDRLKNKDEAAFEMLVRQFQARLYTLAYAMTHDRQESQDIVQEVFLKAYRHIGSFKGDAKLSTWLHRITVNQCLNWKRHWLRRRRWQQRPLAEDNDHPSAVVLTDERTPEASFSEKQLHRRYVQALQSLPEKVRAVYVLKELEGLSYDEIATTLRLRRGTVGSRLHHARRQLQAVVRQYQDGEKS